MASSAKELDYKLLHEYGRARETLLGEFAFPSDKKYARDYIQSTLSVCSVKQAEIILKDLPDSFLSGVYIESDLLRDRVPSYTGFDLNRISKTHLNKITKDTIGSIGNYNKALSANLIEQYNTLLANNELVNSLTVHGWTKNAEERMIKAGFDKEVINLVKQQTTANKMIQVLEQQGIRGGMHPNDVAKLLQPHIRTIFGDGGVLIDNTGKMRRQFVIDADGKYKWIQKKVTRPYRATVKMYSETISRSSMLQAHIDGRTATLKQSGLVEKYRSIANMTSNTCSLCAMMHGQIVSPGNGPEYHANCSCRLQPVWKKETGLTNRTDEFYEKQRDTHFWKQHQLQEYNKTLPKGKKLKNYNFLPKDALKGMPGKEGMRKIRADMLGQPLKSEWTDSKIADTLWEKTSKDGLEHGVIKNAEAITLVGDEHHISSIPTPKTSFELHHTHPEWDAPLSGGDISFFLFHENNKTMIASSSKNIYKATKTRKTLHIKDWERVVKDFDAYADKEYDRLYKVEKELRGKGVLWRQAMINTNKWMATQGQYRFEVIPR